MNHLSICPGVDCKSGLMWTIVYSDLSILHWVLLDNLAMSLTAHSKKILAQKFFPEDLQDALKLIFDDSPDLTETHIVVFLSLLRASGLDHLPEYIATAVETVLLYSDKLESSSQGYVDIVGTGGDSQNTFNVSTSSAIIASAIPGIHVVKHGGKASTSLSGSGDLMAKLGIDLFKINASTAPKIISKSNLCFLFAPSFHHSMKLIAPIRAKMGIPTIFNILGPLLNPINIKSRILGVYSESLGEVYAKAAFQIDVNQNRNPKPYSTMVVWGECGLDEISPVGRTKIWRVVNSKGDVESSYISPADFGLPEHSLDLVRSGTAEENAVKLKKLLKGELGTEIGQDPLLDYILMNTGALAVVSGVAENWKEGVQLALESVTSGAALASLENFVSAVNEV